VRYVRLNNISLPTAAVRCCAPFHGVPALRLGGGGVKWAGDRFSRAEEVTLERNVNDGTLRGSFRIPVGVLRQLAARNTSYGLDYHLDPLGNDEAGVAWLAPGRLLLFFKHAAAREPNTGGGQRTDSGGGGLYPHSSTQPPFTSEPPLFTLTPALMTPEPPLFTPPLFTPQPPLFTPAPRLFTPEPRLFTPAPRLFTPVPPLFTPAPPLSLTATVDGAPLLVRAAYNTIVPTAGRFLGHWADVTKFCDGRAHRLSLRLQEGIELEGVFFDNVETVWANELGLRVRVRG